MMLPWGAMMRAALSLGIGAEAFWRLGVREWCWLAQQTGEGRGLDRAAFEALLTEDRELERERVSDGRD